MWEVVKSVNDVRLVRASVVVFRHRLPDSTDGLHIASIASTFVKIAGDINILDVEEVYYNRKRAVIENDDCKIVLIEQVDDVNDIALVMCKDDEKQMKLGEAIVEALAKRETTKL